MTFRLKMYTLSVFGFAALDYAAASPGKARAMGFRDYSRNFRCTFAEFLKISRVTRAATEPKGFGMPIAVSGKPAYCVDVRGRDVRFVYPGSETFAFAHIDDVDWRPHRSVRDGSEPILAHNQDCAGSTPAPATTHDEATSPPSPARDGGQAPTAAEVTNG